MRSAFYNPYTFIGYKLASYCFTIDLDMFNNCTSGKKLINDRNLSDEQLTIGRNLSTVMDIISGNGYIDGFTINDVDILIQGIATSKACV